MTAATATAARFTAARIDGRYRVLDTELGIPVVTCASKAKAEEKAAAMNAATPVAEVGPERIAEMVQEEAAFRAAVGITAPVTAPEEPSAPLAVVTLDGEETSVEVTATPVRSAAAAWTNPHAKTPAALPEKAAKKTGGRKADPDTRAMWIVVKLAAIMLEDADPAHASIVRKLRAATPNGQGGRTVRLTREEAVTVAAIATEIETAALDAETGWEGAGRLARSCASMRDRATALWA